MTQTLNQKNQGEDLKRLSDSILSALPIILPPSNILPSEWIQNNIRLPTGPSAGQPVTLFSFQKEMLDIINDPYITEIVYQTSSQIAKTTVLNSCLYYWLANDPSSIGIAQSNERELKAWKSTMIDPVLNSTPQIAQIMPIKNDKDSVNNYEQTRLLTGDTIFYMSLNSPAQLRGKTLKRVILDEVAAVKPSAEGSPITLARQRLQTFGTDSKLLISSTPVFRGDLIDQDYQLSDQRKYFVPCPHCSEMQTLDWHNVKFEWKEEDGKNTLLPETARYVCPHCAQPWTELEKTRAVNAGEWRKTNHNAPRHKAGFYINRLYSPFTNIVAMAQDFKDALAKGDLQTFYNTSLGLPFDSTVVNKINPDDLNQYRDSKIDIDHIPADCIALTIGVDVQKNRIEFTTIGVNAQEKIYVLDHRAIHCELSDVLNHSSSVWDRLLMWSNRTYTTESGAVLKPRITLIDSGWGMSTDRVYRLCAKNNRSKWRAIKGSSAFDHAAIPTKPTSAGGFDFYMIGSSQLKIKVSQLLYTALETPDESMIVFSHSLPSDYFDQLTSERLIVNGAVKRWKKMQDRNEALDCLVYAIAGAFISKVKFGTGAKSINVYDSDLESLPYVCTDTELKQDDAQAEPEQTEQQQNQSNEINSTNTTINNNPPQRRPKYIIRRR
jgi:phage terminase large subunit GpA-like protein